MRRTGWHVRFVPKNGGRPSLFDHDETGVNKALGYDTPANVIYKSPHVYWSNVAQQIRWRYHTSMSDEWGDCQSLTATFSELSVRWPLEIRKDEPAQSDQLGFN
jgi:hypothetical protein